MTERKPEKTPQPKKTEGENVPSRGTTPPEGKGLIETLLSDLSERSQKPEPEPSDQEKKKKWAEKEAGSVIKFGEKPPKLALKAAIENVEILENNRGKISFLLPEGASLPTNKNVLQVLADISASGCEGQREYLFVKAAQLRNAVAGSADGESRAVMAKLRDRVLSLYEFSPEDIANGKNASWSKEKMEKWDQINSRLFESIGDTVTPDPTMSKNWLEVDPLDESGKPIDVPKEAQKIIKELKSQSGSVNWREINEEYMKLGSLEGLSDDQSVYVDRVRHRILETFKAMNGNRYQATPQEIYDLTRGPNAARERDRTFYERIRKVLENPNEETHKQMNLYDEADLDTVMDIFGKSVKEVVDPITNERSEVSIGKQVIDHYENLKGTIMRLSDAEYWARHSAGDVENLSKLMGYFENKFAVEAMSDPIVEDMIQCMEMAIKSIRDNNDGYIPQELVRYDPHSQKSYVDDLTLQYFHRRMEAGAVRDYVRDPKTGEPELDREAEGRVYKRTDVHSFEQLDADERNLRELASLRLAKGIGVLTNRTLELYAFTRVPGVDRKLAGGQEMPVFSSTAYEGLTRFVNPMQHWFLKYKFGDTLHLPFFNSLLNRRLNSAEGTAINWSMGQYQEAIDLVSKGDFVALKNKFGDNAGRIADLVEDFSFSGRFGPLSMWGLKDATIDWTAQDFERLGGSVRLTLASGWAESRIKSEFKSQNGSGMTDMQLDEAWAHAKRGEGDWGDKWAKDLKAYEKAYKTYIWTQYVMRNPLGVASQLSVDYEKDPKKVKENPSSARRKLRSQIIEEIFSAEDVEKMKLGKNSLDLEKDMATTRTLTFKQKAVMDRVALLEGDIASVMKIAMTSGDRPRDIRDSDFDVLRTQKNIALQDAKGDAYQISGEERYRQATEYWEKVREYTFGKGTDILGIRDSLCDSSATNVLVSKFNLKGSDKIQSTIEAAFSRISKEALLQSAIDTRLQVHAGTEDVLWSYLDLNTLGDRHWNRRAGDFFTRAKTVQLMMAYFNELKGSPKMEDLVKLIGDIGRSEKNHDPKEAAKFSALFATATANIYRQRHLAGVPIIGRLLPLFGVEMSIAQKAFGVHSASYWSMNNLLKFTDLISAERVVPEKRVLDGVDYGEYNMHELRKNSGSSRVLAMVEMAVIGSVIAAAMTSLSAAAASQKEEK